MAEIAIKANTTEVTLCDEWHIYELRETLSYGCQSPKETPKK